ncbi:hypothetical protein [Actinoplanes solisilvae]|uniref:hypothetical protein n=1 Tax=Actinoplanes solisilvae TaxID=2486853 RepID=UPI001F0CD05D|nr:hypothetical protein [Actinoplanes solisilvae]
MGVVSWAAVAIFVTAYVFIATEKFSRVTVALGGASLMLAIGATDAEHAFFPRTPASTGTSSSCCWG